MDINQIVQQLRGRGMSDQQIAGFLNRQSASGNIAPKPQMPNFPQGGGGQRQMPQMVQARLSPAPNLIGTVLQSLENMGQGPGGAGQVPLKPESIPIMPPEGEGVNVPPAEVVTTPYVGSSPDTPVGNEPTPENYYKYMVAKGADPTKAIGALANVRGESTFNPEAVNKDSGAYGLFQWLGSRKKELIAKYGENPTWQQQMDFAMSEPHWKKYESADTPTPEAASDWFTRNFEIPATNEKDMARISNKYQSYIPEVSDKVRSLSQVPTKDIPVAKPRGVQDVITGGQSMPPASEKEGFEAFMDSPFYQLIMGGTRAGNALENMYARRRENQMREFMAQRMPPELSNLWRYNPEMAMRVLMQQQGGGATDTANIRDWKQIVESSGIDPNSQEAGTLLRNIVLAQKDPAHMQQLAESQAEGKRFPEKMEEMETDLDRLGSFIDRTLNVSTMAREAMSIGDAAGWTQLVSWVRGADAQRLKDLAKSIKTNVAIDQLMKMKTESITGAAGFGQLSVTEFEGLQQSIAALNPDSSPDKLRQDLATVIGHYSNVEEQARTVYNAKTEYFNAYNNKENLKRPSTRKFEKVKPAEEYYKNMGRVRESLGVPQPSYIQSVPGPQQSPAAPQRTIDFRSLR